MNFFAYSNTKQILGKALQWVELYGLIKRKIKEFGHEYRCIVLLNYEKWLIRFCFSLEVNHRSLAGIRYRLKVDFQLSNYYLYQN